MLMPIGMHLEGNHLRASALHLTSLEARPCASSIFELDFHIDPSNLNCLYHSFPFAARERYSQHFSFQLHFLDL